MMQKTILLCAGGTGGHVFPALSLAEELLKRGWRVVFVTDSRGVKYLSGVNNIEVHVISAGPYRGGLKGKIVFGLSLIKGYFQTHALISKIKPDIAVGFGGYPCAPPMFAAQHRGVPTILHEQNAVLGLANKLLAPMAKKIALSFPLNNKGSCRKETVVTGNPVRADIAVLSQTSYPPIEQALSILIFGGSLGAASFAEIIPHSIINFSKTSDLKLSIAHQARDGDLEKVIALYRDAGVAAEVKNFFDDIPARMEKAHLLICRSGASTVAETSCAGRPAIYIPYPWHKDQQQLHNARAVADIGGGWIIEEKDLTVDRLLEILKTVVPGQLQSVAQAAKTLGQPDAASKLAELVLS